MQGTQIALGYNQSFELEIILDDPDGANDGTDRPVYYDWSASQNGTYTDVMSVVTNGAVPHSGVYAWSTASDSCWAVGRKLFIPANSLEANGIYTFNVNASKENTTMVNSSMRIWVSLALPLEPVVECLCRCKTQQ